MSHRDHLPQLDGELFLTDGGIETTLIFHDHLDLPYFAAFDLLDRDGGTDSLRAYYERYARLAVEAGAGFILESPTWRASKDWGILGFATRTGKDGEFREFVVTSADQSIEDTITPETP